MAVGPEPLQTNEAALETLARPGVVGVPIRVTTEAAPRQRARTAYEAARREASAPNRSWVDVRTGAGPGR
ncbi:hypothetical protein J1792_33305 [Streptomyces triculaminicus]|uniref:Uncharacterized protein n=2 Tax=Streptomyces TaxID=1883 RepID=A0A939JTY5_9ACTN|nr:MULTISPECIES: hypothetical protein [Streptomyces]MBO0657417.1 hypothetical protein [Streptomyces triculaminicus]QSY49414.1 hypothetical protein J3S04_31625 [Streptomyces griseocarneus]